MKTLKTGAMSNRWKRQLLRNSLGGFLAALGVILVVGRPTGMAADPRTTVVYNTIPTPLPGNVASEGPEAYAFVELGDGLQLVPTSDTLGRVAVILSSWACQKGHWYSGDCVTTFGATFSQPITVNIYKLVTALPVPVAEQMPSWTVTQTFNIPYRPTSTPNLCNGDNTRWYDPLDKRCYHGLAVPIVVDFSKFGVPLPAINNRLVITVAFNTTHYGPHPIGESASCFTSSGGCPYDSLNISTDTTDGTFVFVGSPLDPNGIFVRYSVGGQGCTRLAVPDVLADDTGCWAGYHPEFLVTANKP